LPTLSKYPKIFSLLLNKFQKFLIWGDLKMKRKITLTVLLVVLLTTYTFGQAVPPPIPPPPPPGLPIDSGIIYLLLAGIALGVKKLRKN
jgi:hypothetical protein